MSQADQLTLAQVLSSEDSSAQNIKDASARLLAILDASPDAFIIIDQDGKIELVNATVESMFLYSKEELLGHNVNMLIPDSVKHAHNTYLSSYKESGNSNIIGTGRKLRAKKSDGKEFPIYLSVGEIKHASHAQFVGIIRDISSEEQYQTTLIDNQQKLTQAARLSSMGELAASIAHEINQPLTAISNYAQAAKRLLSSNDTDKTKMIHQALDGIESQAQRANEFIAGLKALANKHASHRERVALLPLMQESVKLAQLDARVLNHEIILDLEEGQGIEVFADPIQIQQVLLNLIRNALDAIEQVKGSPLLIRTTRLPNSDIEISVADCGTGIEKQTAERIFTPFFTTKTSGMGIGLAVCKTIINAHGGCIYFAENVPKGCIFSFSLPLFNKNQRQIEKTHG
ncbi:two-component system sensor histidine kinase NtrB [Brumicola nitratireducens]|uniref:Sensor protein FixL n=1 Tax=Glaciecola nitratireducens (strain JCM 12485 / KCTC 12276 / FR1064) TaxID=1085623 RepID=G4QEA1_GLANF|nr:PAS domain S-box protein [Glaciecola nitratireducens]AEP31375.1 PAS/PAC sensor signal transduction histidine kinase [Glaciecola nitratireducens FR1064]